MTDTGTSGICLDGTHFGPASTCRQLDFTPLFENIVLVALPNAILIALFCTIRLPRLLPKPIVLRRPRHSQPQRHQCSQGKDADDAVSNEKPGVPRDEAIKRVPSATSSGPAREATSAIFSSLDWLGILRIVIAVLVFVLAAALMGTSQSGLGLSPELAGGWSFALAQAFQLVGSFALVIAVGLERLKTRGGNFILPTYLLSTILFDGARLRTLKALDFGHPSASISTSPFFAILAASLALKVLLLFSECFNTRSLRDAQANFPSCSKAAIATEELHERHATFFNRLGFFWLFPTMLRGFRKSLQMSDLPSLHEKYSAEVLGKRFERVWDAKVQSQRRAANEAGDAADFLSQPSCSSDTDRSKHRTKPLLLAIIRACPSIAFGPVLPRLTLTAVLLAQPFLISDTITFIETYAPSTPSAPDPFEPSISAPLPAAQGWALAGAFCAVYTVSAVSTGAYYWIVSQNGASLRGILIDQLFKKSLRIHAGKIEALGPAGAANLMSSDVERCISALDPVHELWSGAIVISVGMYILYLNVGLAFIAPLITVLLFFLGTPILGKKLGMRQRNWSEKIDQRLAVTSSMLNGIRAVKMGGLESFFTQKLLRARAAEMDMLKRYFYTEFWVVVASNYAGTVIQLGTFAALSVIAHLSTSTSYRFDTKTVFTALTAINIISRPMFMIGQQFAMSIAAFASLRRIENFLLCEERLDEPNSESSEAMQLANGNDGAHVTIQNATVKWTPRSDAILHDLNMSLNPGITMVIGPLSSGKSTLIATILGEAYVSQGEVNTPLRAECRPVAFSPQDSWMQETLSVRDNITFHSDAPIDKAWYDTVVRACCLEPDFSTFEHGDHRLAKALSGGQKQRISLARAVYAREAELVLLDDPFSALDADTEAQVWTALFDRVKGLLRGKTVLLASNALHRMKDVDWIIQLENATILRQGPPATIHLSDEERERLDLAAKSKEDAARESDELADNIIGDEADALSLHQDDFDGHGDGADGNAMEKVQENDITFKTYKIWFESAGYLTVVSIFVLFGLGIAGMQGSAIYLQHWTAKPETQKLNQFGTLLGGYFAIFGAYFAVYFVGLYVYQVHAPQHAGRALHARLLEGVIRAPLSFFDTRSTGTVLNRFSQDLFAADDLWIAYFGNTVAASYKLIIIMVVAAPFLLIVLAALSVLVYALRRFYIPSSRQLRRLEMSSKSPLYTLFADSTNGLVVIRAYGRQDAMRALAAKYLNDSQRPYYFLWACRRWLQVWLNGCSMISNTALVLIIVAMRHAAGVAVFGVALSQTVTVSDMLNTVVTSWAEAEIAGVVFERIAEFARTIPEKDTMGSPASKDIGEHPKDSTKESIPPASVTFDNAVLSYTPGVGEPVLKGISFEVHAGEHFGICGRTGSGKSTILLALLRMVERQSGDIRLNHATIDNLRLHTLRRSISVVGQEPLIVNGASLRENLELEGPIPEDRIWNVLRDTRLHDFVRHLPSGLDTVLGPETAHLSQGRRQLLTIARAILNPKPLVILDEVSSAMDEETDTIVQELLRTCFRRSTIISIAHRISGLLSMDRVMVLGAGEILELESPKALLAQAGSTFRSLASHQGLL
ncbi:hypothetical protein CF327_g3818 [Tilletia walkeri]|nr:hypothetical protein CF327_g3818 [Tilletia walkeri]